MKIIKNKTIKSAAWYTFSNIFAKAITLLITPVFTRLLTKAEYGEYTNYVSWQNILLTIFSLELSATVLRAKFDRSTQDSFNSYVFTISWFSVSVTFILGVLLFLVNLNPWVHGIIGINRDYIWMLCAVIIFSPILHIYQAQQRAEIRYKTSSVITIAYGIFSFLVPYFMVKHSQNGLRSLLCGLSLNAVVWGVSILIYISTRKRGPLNKADIGYALVFSLPIVPHLVSNIIMGNSDKIMIKNMCGAEFAAMYGLVYTCALAINLLRNSLNNAWLPWFYKKMNEKDHGAIKKISRIYILFFSFGSLLICLLGPEIVMVLGGRQYQDALVLLPIIMLGCYYNFLNLFYVNIEFYEKKTFMISVITVCTAVMNLALNYICIKAYGYRAAAYTTAFCNFCIVLFHYIVTRKMENEKMCNNKLIFSMMLISFGMVFVCVSSYGSIVLRMGLLAVLCVVMILFFLKLKNQGLLKKVF